MNFGTAHKQLMDGAKMSRTSWPFPADTITFDFERQKLVAANPDKAVYQRYQDGRPGYYPTQADMRARDWEFVR